MILNLGQGGPKNEYGLALEPEEANAKSKKGRVRKAEKTNHLD